MKKQKHKVISSTIFSWRDLARGEWLQKLDWGLLRSIHTPYSTTASFVFSFLAFRKTFVAFLCLEVFLSFILIINIQRQIEREWESAEWHRENEKMVKNKTDEAWYLWFLLVLEIRTMRYKESIVHSSQRTLSFRCRVCCVRSKINEESKK